MKQTRLLVILIAFAFLATACPDDDSPALDEPDGDLEEPEMPSETDLGEEDEDDATEDAGDEDVDDSEGDESEPEPESDAEPEPEVVSGELVAEILRGNAGPEVAVWDVAGPTFLGNYESVSTAEVLTAIVPLGADDPLLLTIWMLGGFADVEMVALETFNLNGAEQRGATAVVHLGGLSPVLPDAFPHFGADPGGAIVGFCESGGLVTFGGYPIAGDFNGATIYNPHPGDPFPATATDSRGIGLDPGGEGIFAVDVLRIEGVFREVELTTPPDVPDCGRITVPEAELDRLSALIERVANQLAW